MPNERTNVDAAIGRAQEIIDAPDFKGSTKDICRIAVFLTEAVVRQVRDLDDDVWQLKIALNGTDVDGPSLFDLVREQMGDVSITANRLAEALENAVASRDKKGGLF